MLLVFFITVAATLWTGGQCQPAKPCCVKADQYQTTLNDLTSINNEHFNFSLMAMDYTRKQQAVLSFTLDPATGQSKLIARSVLDFGKQKMFIIPAANQTLCIKQDYKFPLLRCIPDNAQYLGSSYLGALTKLPYEGWRFTTPEYYNMVITLAVDPKECVPLVEGVNIGGNKQMFLFSSFEEKIKNPEWFNLPPSCQK